MKKKFLFGLCLLACWPLAGGLQADQARNVTMVSAVGTSTTGSVYNVGQTMVGISTGATQIAYHGVMYALRVETQCALGDMNCDGKVNGLDIQIYKNVILTGVGTPSELHSAGIDIPTFVGLLLN